MTDFEHASGAESAYTGISGIDDDADSHTTAIWGGTAGDRIALEGNTSSTGDYPTILARNEAGTSSSNALAAYNGSTGGYPTIYGENDGSSGTCYAVYGRANATVGGYGVFGYAPNGSSSNGSTGVYGQSDGIGYGIYGKTTAEAQTAIYAIAEDGGVAVEGQVVGSPGFGFYGGVDGEVFSAAVYAYASGDGVSNGDVNGVFAYAPGTNAYAGWFQGDAYVSGYLYKPGGGFRIDHPLDPENKTLTHSFVESPDMKNIYDGVAVADTSGEIVVQMPAYFDALNMDFRYQLTAIGAPAPGLHVKEKLSQGSFTLAGAAPGQEVSWQVTGIRKDAWAQANRLGVEEEKPKAHLGLYLQPEAHGQPPQKRVNAEMLARGESRKVTRGPSPTPPPRRARGAPPSP